MTQNAKEVNGEASPAKSTGKDALKTTSFGHSIGKSASGLLQNAFGTPSGRAVAGALKSLNHETSKDVSSAASGGSGEASSASQASLIRKDQNTTGASSAGESFRSISSNDRVNPEMAQAAFDRFAAGPRNVHASTKPIQPVPSLNEKRSATFSGSSEGFCGLLAPCSRETMTASEKLASAETDRKIYQVLASIDKKIRGGSELLQGHNENCADGAEVVALLSDPTFSVDDYPRESWKHEPNERNETDKGLAETHSDPQKCAMAAARNVARPLDLIPDFNGPLDSQITSTMIQDTSCWPAVNVVAASHVGEVQPWMEKLTRYHDEVWGDMLPLVLEAREEIRVAKASNEGALQDRPPLRRLGMLLGHLGALVP